MPEPVKKPEPSAAWRYSSADGVGAAEGLAVDEAMMLRYGRGRARETAATLRLYSYRPHCALVGRYQSLEDEVDLDYCRRHDVQVGRRPTGGGAIIMGPGQLGVAVAAPARAEEAPRDTLRRFAGGVLAGLEQLGIAAAFRSKNDLEVEGRKIAGLGLFLDPRGAVLFHASVLVDLDVPLMLRILRISGAKLAGKAARAVGERVTTVSEQRGETLAAADVRDAVRDGFAAAMGARLVPGMLDAEELRRRDRLTVERYGARAWTHQRSPRRDARGSAVIKTPIGLLRIYVSTHGETIKNVLITGDYNQLPAELAALEAALRWRPARRDRIAAACAEALAGGTLGVAPSALGETIWRATESALGVERRSHPQRLAGSCYAPEAVRLEEAR